MYRNYWHSLTTEEREVTLNAKFQNKLSEKFKSFDFQLIFVWLNGKLLIIYFI